MRKFPGSLHGHTDFSNFRLRDSINTVQESIDYALELGHEVIAITDHETVSSWIKVEKYYDKIKKKNPNFKVIRGNEIYLVRNGLNNENYDSSKDRYFHFILLAKDSEGARQIREISTRAWMRAYSSRGMWRVPTYYQDLIDVIGANPGHVIGSTACIGGALGTQLLRNRDTGAPAKKVIEQWVLMVQKIFGKEDFYLEMQPSNNKDQIYINEEILKLSEKYNIKFIITTDSHYLKKEDRPIHKAFLNSQQGDREVDAFYATTYMMDTEELESYMTIGEENLEKAYETILEIKNKCEDFSMLQPLRIPRMKWKTYTINQDKVNYYLSEMKWLNTFWESKYKEDRHLVYALIDGIEKEKTLQNKKTYKEIDKCLEDVWISSEINGSRWSAYFLNLQNIIDICWDAGSLVGCGRGSGVGFIILYILGITQINPLREKSPTMRWRFLNPDRVSVLDVDIDIEGTKRSVVMNRFREVYGDDRVANVLTLRTEKSKSAILTACRGLGIDVDEAQYLASMIEADRGQLRTLTETYYGNKDKGFGGNKTFQKSMEEYPEVWQVAQKIEGLINGIGVHAGGTVFVDRPFTDSGALMRSPKGDIITQYELHDLEEEGDIKYDILSIEALDKIHNCLDLICEYGYEEPEETLRKTYEKICGVYNLERTDPEMWEMCWEHQVTSLFQMEKQSGIQGIEKIKPKDVDELAILNSVIRLMAPERGAEIPLDTWVRHRKHPNDWILEMREYGLTEKEIKWLKEQPGIVDGMCVTQEGMMMLVQEEKLGGNSLNFADRARKGIAKKQGKLFEECEKEFFERAEDKKCSDKLVHYVWDELLRAQRGYSFNLSHTLAYSIIGLQELNLAFHYPVLLWNCACLISDSGGAGDGKGVNYGKIATAIGKFKSEGIEITPPNINESSYTFSPNIEENIILHGLSGITRVSNDLIQEIMNGRPYDSLDDFLNRIKVNKLQMVNLIKAGAFDCFGNRINVMKQYIDKVADKKKRITLQNMRMLIKYDLLPKDYDFEIRVYNFNIYLKKQKEDNYYLLDNVSFEFYENYYDLDLLIRTENSESGFKIEAKTWNKIYQKEMDTVRAYLKENNKELLTKLNDTLFKETWDKYCLGSLSKWEMDSLSCYIHEHELAAVNNHLYGFSNYFMLPRNPQVEYTFKPKNSDREVPIFKITRIIGTVLDRDKNKKSVTLLTINGVVDVKIYGGAFTYYDKQISIKGEDGKKHVVRKSDFSRGNKVIITGIRREDMFLGKKYSRTPYHLVELIENINDDGSLTINPRAEEDE